MHKNRSILTLIILLSISIGLMVFNLTVKVFDFKDVFFFITYPIEYSVQAVSGFFGNLFKGVTRINELEDELVITQERLVNYQEKLLLYTSIVEENEELKDLLDVKESIDYETSYARVIYRDPSLNGDFLVIDKGSVDGIVEDMPVVSFDSNETIFLVGKTIEVNLTASKVKIITAKNFYLGVSLKDSGYVGILSGNGSWNQNCVVDFIPVEANAYAGQNVITSGESDIFPDNILVGTVVGVGQSVMDEFFSTLYVKPEFEYSTISHVFIIDWEPAAEVNILIETSYEQ